MITGSFERGTAGECFTSEIMGETFVVKAVFAAPGVPPLALVEGFQFKPESLLKAGFWTSMDLPLSAGVDHAHPSNWVSRMRSAQSPSLA